MKGLVCFFTIAIFSCTVLSCPSPVGNIGGSSGGVYWAQPTRTNYLALESFQPNDDVKVFISNNGSVQSIPIADVTFTIIEDPDNYPDDEKTIDKVNGFLLREPGRNIIVVDYNNQITKYSIMVWDPNDVGGNGGGSDDTGIGIIWIN